MLYRLKKLFSSAKENTSLQFYVVLIDQDNGRPTMAPPMNADFVLSKAREILFDVLDPYGNSIRISDFQYDGNNMISAMLHSRWKAWMSAYFQDFYGNGAEGVLSFADAAYDTWMEGNRSVPKYVLDGKREESDTGSLFVVIKPPVKRQNALKMVLGKAKLGLIKDIEKHALYDDTWWLATDLSTFELRCSRKSAMTSRFTINGRVFDLSKALTGGDNLNITGKYTLSALFWHDKTDYDIGLLWTGRLDTS